MNKINFQNLPNTITPVNATNLNQVQTNVENVFKVLGEGLLDSNNDISDCNDTSLATGIYFAPGTTTNTPFSNSAWFIVHIKRDTTNITQFAIRYRDNAIYERQYNTVSPSGWKAWQEVGIRSTITAGLNSNYTISANSTYEKLPLSVISSIGSELSFSSNSIVIGGNITKVLVSFMVLYESSTSGQKYLQVYKNGNGTVPAINYVVGGNKTQIVQTPIIIDVTANDVLDLRVYGSKNDVLSANRVFMTVEAIS